MGIVVIRGIGRDAPQVEPGRRPGLGHEILQVQINPRLGRAVLGNGIVTRPRVGGANLESTGTTVTDTNLTLAGVGTGFGIAQIAYSNSFANPAPTATRMFDIDAVLRREVVWWIAVWKLIAREVAVVESMHSGRWFSERSGLQQCRSNLLERLLVRCLGCVLLINAPSKLGKGCRDALREVVD